MLAPIHERLATLIGCRPAQVLTTVQLLDDGATVPFIARYRKEATGGLDDSQLRLLEERLGYLRELEERRAKVLQSIEQQGLLDEALAQAIAAAETKTRLEDLYLPFRPRRRTKAQIAREAGLEPLAKALCQTTNESPEALALAFVAPAKGVPDSTAALDGARQIVMETWAEDPSLSGEIREWLWENATLSATVNEDKQQLGQKFRDYFDFTQQIKQIPSHRALALFRGRNDGVLHLRLTIEEDEQGQTRPERMLAARFRVREQGRPTDQWLLETIRLTWRAKLGPRLELELLTRLREIAEQEAIAVFARNLHDLLLAAPAGPRATIGLDPGLRTGVKVAIVDRTGKVVHTDTVYPHPPRNQWAQSVERLRQLAQTYAVDLIAIGNGTGSRETDRLASEVLTGFAKGRLHKLTVSEAGASVYSASELASNELPGLDVSLRGAVSIARRLQDPLAELVKIDPKSIGVGQYQHDVNQTSLARTLEKVVEDCVGAVGVDLNTASPALLAQVSGLSESLAERIVEYRNEHGAFRSRLDLLRVSRLGAKTFEQAAGFLRIMDGDNPLDRSAVHPEAYPVVKRLLQSTKLPIETVIGNTQLLRQLSPESLTDERFGLPTVQDILAELEKPGRDPRPEFRTATFQEGVERLEDLTPGMVLEGVITNVTNFGAFVDIGVHQDGLVHISAMSDKFVKNPHDLVKAGDILRVKVMAVDKARNRIGLSMRLDDEPGTGDPQTASENPHAPGRSTKRQKPSPRQRDENPADHERTTRKPSRSHREAATQHAKARAPQAKPESALAQALSKAGLGKED